MSESSVRQELEQKAAAADLQVHVAQLNQRHVQETFEMEPNALSMKKSKPFLLEIADVAQDKVNKQAKKVRRTLVKNDTLDTNAQLTTIRQYAANTHLSTS